MRDTQCRATHAQDGLALVQPMGRRLEHGVTPLSLLLPLDLHLLEASCRPLADTQITTVYNLHIEINIQTSLRS